MKLYIELLKLQGNIKNEEIKDNNSSQLVIIILVVIITFGKISFHEGNEGEILKAQTYSNIRKTVNLFE